MKFSIFYRSAICGNYKILFFSSESINLKLNMGKFQMGKDTLAIPMSLFRNNRSRVVEALKSSGVDSGAIILLEGGRDIPYNDTDVSYIFKQESFFQYMFGVKEPDCYGAINIGDEKSTLFIPHLPEEYEVWMGRLHTLTDFQGMYEVDSVEYSTSLKEFFTKAKPSVILTLSGVNSDSGLSCKPASFEGIEHFNINYEVLYPILAECRVIKSPEEIEVLRYVAKVSSDAHMKVMKFIKPGVTEYQAESLFLHHSYAVGGCRHTSYTCICGSGINSSVLHYGHAAAPNDRTVQDGDMCLFDMGANYCGYAADITCSFPCNGKFTADQKLIYNAVLGARNAVLETIREGVSWVEMHKLSNKVMLEHLKNGGMLKGNISEMLEAGLGAIFQPHGLGHLLGLDVHDVGGYIKGQPERPTEVGLNKLRFARILKKNMYVTVEPGCYFIECLMDKALNDPKLNKFINKDIYVRFRKFGGVRIEDDVWIKKDGCENFAIVPRTIEEIEKFMTT